MSGASEHKPRFQLTLFSFLGAVAGAFSLFSMAQNAFQFGLAPIMADFVEYYRTLGQWVFGWIGWPFGWDVPLWLRDAWTISIIGSGLAYRIELTETKEGLDSYWSQEVNNTWINEKEKELALEEAAEDIVKMKLAYRRDQWKGLIIIPVQGLLLIGLYYGFITIQYALRRRPSKASLEHPSFPRTMALADKSVLRTRHEIFYTFAILILFFAVNAFGLSVA